MNVRRINQKAPPFQKERSPSVSTSFLWKEGDRASGGGWPSHRLGKNGEAFPLMPSSLKRVPEGRVMPGEVISD